MHVKMKRLFSALAAALLLVGCAGNGNSRLTGTWISEPFKGSWGEEVSKLSIHPDGTCTIHSSYAAKDRIGALVLGSWTSSSRASATLTWRNDSEDSVAAALVNSTTLVLSAEGDVMTFRKLQ
jgi:hypothetical protein